MRRVFILVHGLASAAVSKGAALRCARRAAPHCRGSACRRAQSLARGLQQWAARGPSSCGWWAVYSAGSVVVAHGLQLLWGMWDLPERGLEPVPTALRGGFLSTLPPGKVKVAPYTVHGILQARTLEWVAFPFSRGSSQPRDWTQISHIGADSLPAEPQGKPKNTVVGSLSLLQWIFLAQESNWGLLHCKWILYQLNYHQGSPLLAFFFFGNIYLLGCTGLSWVTWDLRSSWQHVKSSHLNRDVTLYWECGVLADGPPGKSLNVLTLLLLFF